MKSNVHPPQHKILVTCVCNNQFSVYSSYNATSMNIEVCHKCHPFYTGKRQAISTAGRIDSFNNKFNKFKEQNKKNLTKADSAVKNSEKKLRKESKKIN